MAICLTYRAIGTLSIYYFSMAYCVAVGMEDDGCDGSRLRQAKIANIQIDANTKSRTLRLYLTCYTITTF